MKYRVILSIICSCLLIIFIIYINLPNSKKENTFSWDGHYYFCEAFPTNQESPSYPTAIVIEYNVYIYYKTGDLFAEIINQGWQTGDHFHSIVIEDDNKIDIYFSNFLEDNAFDGYYQEGDLLLSLSLENDQLYTTWHKLQSETSYMSNEVYGIYYEKIK